MEVEQEPAVTPVPLPPTIPPATGNQQYIYRWRSGNLNNILIGGALATDNIFIGGARGVKMV